MKWPYFSLQLAEFFSDSGQGFYDFGVFADFQQRSRSRLDFRKLSRVTQNVTLQILEIQRKYNCCSLGLTYIQAPYIFNATNHRLL